MEKPEQEPTKVEEEKVQQIPTEETTEPQEEKKPLT